MWHSTGCAVPAMAALWKVEVLYDLTLSSLIKRNLTAESLKVWFQNAREGPCCVDADFWLRVKVESLTGVLASGGAHHKWSEKAIWNADGLARPWLITTYLEVDCETISYMCSTEWTWEVWDAPRTMQLIRLPSQFVIKPENITHTHLFWGKRKYRFWHYAG